MFNAQSSGGPGGILASGPFQVPVAPSAAAPAQALSPVSPRRKKAEDAAASFMRWIRAPQQVLLLLKVIICTLLAFTVWFFIASPDDISEGSRFRFDLSWVSLYFWLLSVGFLMLRCADATEPLHLVFYSILVLLLLAFVICLFVRRRFQAEQNDQRLIVVIPTAVLLLAVVAFLAMFHLVLVEYWEKEDIEE